jgi:hypothetical protein
MTSLDMPEYRAIVDVAAARLAASTKPPRAMVGRSSSMVNRSTSGSSSSRSSAYGTRNKQGWPRIRQLAQQFD